MRFSFYELVESDEVLLEAGVSVGVDLTGKLLLSVLRNGGEEVDLMIGYWITFEKPPLPIMS